ncbi:MAG: hypothetical protein HDQ99_03475 [Lachnospiraceae bacterium]|nr:hypothetical protein [Lachnospiraceae bacterium]
MKKREKSRMLKRMRRVAAAGLAGCLFAVMCPAMNVSASETITRENFDYVRYADDYKDLKEAFGYDAEALYNHYLTCGISEQRTAYSVVSSDEFDYVRYADDYKDLKEAFGYDAKALYNHYLNNGRAEGRIAYRNDGSAIGNQTGTDNAGTAAKTEQTGKKVLTPQEQKLVDEGWEWNSNWGMWVR